MVSIEEVIRKKNSHKGHDIVVLTDGLFCKTCGEEVING